MRAKTSKGEVIQTRVAQKLGSEAPCDGINRVPICIAPETREKLRSLLLTERFHGIGYTAFVEMAMKQVNPEEYNVQL